MSRSGEDTGLIVLGFPRVSGDEPASGGTDGDGKTFSPRERG